MIRDATTHHLPNEPRLTFAEYQTETLEGDVALIIVTEWREFSSLDLDTLEAHS